MAYSGERGKGNVGGRAEESWGAQWAPSERAWLEGGWRLTNDKAERSGDKDDLLVLLCVKRCATFSIRLGCTYPENSYCGGPL